MCFFFLAFAFVFLLDCYSYVAASTQETACSCSSSLAFSPIWCCPAVETATTHSSLDFEESPLWRQELLAQNQARDGYHTLVLRVVSQDSERIFFQLPLVWDTLAECYAPISKTQTTKATIPFASSERSNWLDLWQSGGDFRWTMALSGKCEVTEKEHLQIAGKTDQAKQAQAESWTSSTSCRTSLGARSTQQRRIDSFLNYGLRSRNAPERNIECSFSDGPTAHRRRAEGHLQCAETCSHRSSQAIAECSITSSIRTRTISQSARSSSDHARVLGQVHLGGRRALEQTYRGLRGQRCRALGSYSDGHGEISKCQKRGGSFQGSGGCLGPHNKGQHRSQRRRADGRQHTWYPGRLSVPWSIPSNAFANANPN